MSEINFPVGTKKYTVNGKAEIAFNPSSVVLVERLFVVLEDLDKKQKDYQAQMQGMKPREIFDFFHKVEKEMRGMLDEVFGYAISDIVFPDGQRVMDFADGLPQWCNFILAIVDIIDASLEEDDKKSKYRIDKYTAKYKKRKK